MILPCLVQRALILVGVLLGLGLGACSATPDVQPSPCVATVQSAPAEEEPWVAIGDEISVHDFDHPELQIPRLRVDIDGTVLLPGLDPVVVAGLTHEQIEEKLTKQYAPYFHDLDIEVRIFAQGPKYYVFGRVENPGERDFRDDLTLFEAVMSATPKTGSGNLGRVRLIRADPRDPFVRYFDLQTMIERGDSSANVHVREGDVIDVPAIEEPASSTPR